MPYFSAEKMAPTFERLSKDMPTTPVDAHFEGDDTKAWVVPAVPGRVLKPEETAAALNAAALKTTGRTAEAVATLTEPEFTTAEAEAMGIKDLLSVRTTEFEGTKNRQNNVRVAVAAIDGEGKRYLAPGEEFSFIKVVGPRTPEQGYKEALRHPAQRRPGWRAGRRHLPGGDHPVQLGVLRRPQGDRAQEPHHVHHPLSAGPGRGRHHRRGRPEVRQRHRPLHLDQGRIDGIETTFWIYGTSDGREVTFRNSGIYNQGPAPNTWKRVDATLPTGKTVVVSAGTAAHDDQGDALDHLARRHQERRRVHQQLPGTPEDRPSRALGGILPARPSKEG